ncbi:hypothetical protein [Thermococcus sp.]
MGEEPPSRSVETNFLRAFLISKDVNNLSENLRGVLASYLNSLQSKLGIEGQTLNIVPVDSFSELSNTRRLLYPLSELDVRKGTLYVLRGALEDTMTDPLTGPFYIATWEMLSAQSLMVVPRSKIPLNINGAFLGGIISSMALFSGDNANVIAGERYLDNLFKNAKLLASEVSRAFEGLDPFSQYDLWSEQGAKLQFYIHALYQLIYDSLSLWMGSTLGNTLDTILGRSLILRKTIDFLVKDPNLNVPEFHKRSVQLALALGDELGREIAKVAQDATHYLLYVENLPRTDEDIDWRMFR